MLIGPKARPGTQEAADRLGQSPKDRTSSHHERVYLAAPVKIGGPDPGSGVLVVSESLEPYEATRTEIIVGPVLLGLLVTAGATGIAAWTVGRTLTPVEDMAALADEWSERHWTPASTTPAPATRSPTWGRPSTCLLDRVAGALVASSCSPPSSPTSCAPR